MASFVYLNAVYNPKQLANRLKLYREQQGWSQVEVASRVGVKQATISNFENNPDKSQLGTMFKIIQAMGVNLIIDTPTSHTEAANDTNINQVRENDEPEW